MKAPQPIRRGAQERASPSSAQRGRIRACSRGASFARAVGNRSLAELVAGRAPLAMLEMSRPGATSPDPPVIQRRCAQCQAAEEEAPAGAAASIQRRCAECEAEEEEEPAGAATSIQRRDAAAPGPGEQSPGSIRSAWGLAVSQPGDPGERGADRLARRALGGGSGGWRRRPLQAPAANAGVADGAGQSLPRGARDYFEPRFGFDLSTVRIHTGSAAARAAESVTALAYTAGRNIVWGARAPTPDSAPGRELLAHELAHVIQQGARGSADLQRQCLPSAVCPIVTVSLGGSGFRWEAAEICMQRQYPFKGVVGSNRDWRFLPAPPGSVEQRDLDCFKQHLVAKSGMFLAQPDIIDFTRAEIYDVTTVKQAHAHHVRLWADTEEATALAANPACSGTGRLWRPGTWQPQSCYWLGGDMYMLVVNERGLLLYDVIKDVSKELAAAAILAAIIAAANNQIKKKLATALATRVPHLAAALAAVTILVVLTTDAELAFAADGDPIESLIKAIENSGETLPDEIKDAMRNDPDLRSKIEAAAAEKDPSKRAKMLSNAALKVIAKNKDKFSREDLEALTTMVQIGADDKLPNKAPTVDALKKQAERIRSGKVPDPEAGTTAGGKKAAKPGEGKTTADIEKEVAADRPTLKPETVKKIAAAPELARKLLDRIAGKTGAGKPLTDADIERLLAAVPSDLTPAEFDKLAAKLEAGTSQEPSELLTNLEKHLALVRKESRAATAAELEKKHPKLSPAAREKLAKASPAARRMLEAVAASGLGGVALTDETVDRFLRILSEAVAPEQVEAIVARLAAVKPDDTIDSVLSNLERAVKSKAKPAGEAAAAERGGGKGKGSGERAGRKTRDKRGRVKVPPEAQLLARKLALLAGKVSPGEYRLEWDGKRPVRWTKKSGCRFFGKSADGIAYIARVSVVFTKVDGDQATYKINTATKLYDLNGEVVVPDKPLRGRILTLTMDPPEEEKK